MAEVKKAESQVKLEGEIQDACSICLDAFWFNPSTGEILIILSFAYDCYQVCISSPNIPKLISKLKTGVRQALIVQYVGNVSVLKILPVKNCLRKVGERRSVEGGGTPGSDGINAEAASAKPKFVDEGDIVYRDELPAYITTTVNKMNESVGIREAERLLKKSDGEVLKLSVSHLMKAAVLMVEHNRRTFDLTETSRKTQDELEGSRKEIAVLRMEMAETQEAKFKLKEDLKQLKGLGIEVEKLRIVVAAKEAEAVAAVESFKNSEEFEVLKQEYKRQGRVISLMQSRNELDRARAEIADLCREKASAVERSSQVEQEMVKLKVASQVEQEMVKLKAKLKKNCTNDEH
ncbi:Uncharacterized protein Adt_07864 [Abeliophyllum distichum]|uniref:Uncharacterized protein n=1 Tax=Abeliophyllum distichum TaxID=126358 RepID=A0ABD1VD49_9LAMI